MPMHTHTGTHTHRHTHARTSHLPAFAPRRARTLFICCRPSQLPAWPSGPPLDTITSSRKPVLSPKPMDPLLPRQPVDSSWVSYYTQLWVRLRQRGRKRVG